MPGHTARAHLRHGGANVIKEFPQHVAEQLGYHGNRVQRHRFDEKILPAEDVCARGAAGRLLDEDVAERVIYFSLNGGRDVPYRSTRPRGEADGARSSWTPPPTCIESASPARGALR